VVYDDRLIFASSHNGYRSTPITYVIQQSIKSIL